MPRRKRNASDPLLVVKRGVHRVDLDQLREQAEAANQRGSNPFKSGDAHRRQRVVESRRVSKYDPVGTAARQHG